MSAARIVPTQIVIVPNIENASNDSGSPTRNFGPASEMLSHWIHDSTKAALTMTTVVHAYTRRGHIGVIAAVTSSTRPPPSRTRIGERANQSIEGATKSAPMTALMVA